MKLRAVAGKPSDEARADAAPRPTDAAAGGPDCDATEDGSRDESFFEARPWLDSDSEDDFYSVRGDFTPSRGSTPDHQRQTLFNGPVPVDRPNPSLVQKKQRLIELLQEKQHYDDEDDGVTAEHLKPSRKGGKLKTTVKSGCFPSSVWKHSFKMCRNTRTEQKRK